VEHERIYELSAAYALHALADDELREFKQHLAVCTECRELVASFQDVAAALAYDVDAPVPPSALRERILVRARAERPSNVVPLRRRWTLPTATAVAAVAACAAIGLGVWAATLNSRLDDRAEVVALAGARGSLVVQPSGEAALIVSGLARAPAGKTYELWVIHEGTPLAAGLFEAAEGRTAVALTRRVPDGAVVAVTLERTGGVPKPTTRPIITAQTA
jgi:anti-sigma-K factor RskA